MIEIGQVVEFRYPVTTHVRFESPLFEVRAVEVFKIRDLVEHPLTFDEYLRRPYVRRSRWMIGGVDLHSKQFRQFYLGCSPEYRAPSQLRIGGYNGERCRPTSIYYRGFEPTLEDRKQLIKLAMLLRSRSDLRIFADDLRLIS
jgi:hypothetical protein